MKKIKLSDFNFEFSGYGHYKVTYTSPVTLKQYKNIISDMEIIDNTKNSDSPKICDLITLKNICKNL